MLTYKVKKSPSINMRFFSKEQNKKNQLFGMIVLLLGRTEIHNKLMKYKGRTSSALTRMQTSNKKLIKEMYSNSLMKEKAFDIKAILDSGVMKEGIKLYSKNKFAYEIKVKQNTDNSPILLDDFVEEIEYELLEFAAFIPIVEYTIESFLTLGKNLTEREKVLLKQINDHLSTFVDYVEKLLREEEAKK